VCISAADFPGGAGPVDATHHLIIDEDQLLEVFPDQFWITQIDNDDGESDNPTDSVQLLRPCAVLALHNG
jgi:hypothetical protein